MPADKPVKFTRMQSGEFAAALENLNLTQGDFCRMTGSSRKKVMEWANGSEDIPPWVPPFFAACIAGGFDAAWKEAERRREA